MNQKATDSSVAYLLYRFKSKTNRTYIVMVESYPNDFYAVKFYPKNHAGQKDKYNTITNVGESVKPIVYTCVSIMLDIARKEPFSSFGFLGSNTMHFAEKTFTTKNKVSPCLSHKRKLKKEKESLKNTQRYRIYHRIVSTLISQTEFEHYDNDDISCFALFRRDSLSKNSRYKDDIIKYFKTNYKEAFAS